MSTSTQQRLSALLDSIRRADPTLSEELKDKQQSAAVKDEAREIQSQFGASAPSNHESFQREDYTEAVILRVGRPVLIIQENETELVIDDAESEIWRSRLENARQSLSIAIPAVGRVELRNHPFLDWCGTGFLVDATTIVTNRHVAELFGRQNGQGFIFRPGADGQDISCHIDLLKEFQRPDEKILKVAKILYIEPEPGPDIAFLRVEPLTEAMPTPIPLQLEPLPLHHEVAVIGYPAKDSRMPDVALMERIFGDVYNQKRLAPGKLTDVSATKLKHDCSTLGGNSGSAVLDLASGKVVGIHFAGRFLESNHAVPAAVISQKLEAVKSGKAFFVKPSGEKPHTAAAAGGGVPPKAVPNPNGQTITIPLQLNITVSVTQGTATTAVTTAAPEETDEFFTEGRAEDYADREGYLENFLGEGFEVPIPEVTTTKQKRDILTYDNNGETDHVLRYEHFSVVMSKSRRLCFFSAVNIDGANSKKEDRVGWRLDPRIPKDAQIIHECYGSYPRYSRGHMTRREDPVWGDQEEASRGNADSMVVTNVVPQMQTFNAPVWLKLENYALDHAREDAMRISVFTGPFFQSTDEISDGVKIPKLFWKVIAFIHDETGELCATGYKMSQEDHLPDREFVYGEFGTVQVPISTIEKEAGLSFGGLAAFDPLANEAAFVPAVKLDHVEQIRFTI